MESLRGRCLEEKTESVGANEAMLTTSSVRAS
jgi:hypothetical protein